MALVIVAGSFLLAGIALVADKEGATQHGSPPVGGVALYTAEREGG
jgi:hypothetical protein